MKYSLKNGFKLAAIVGIVMLLSFSAAAAYGSINSFSGPDTATQGETITITAVIENTDSEDGAIRLAIDYPSSDWTYQGSSSDGARENTRSNRIEWSWDNVSAGDTRNPSVSVQVPTDAAGNKTFDAQAGSGLDDHEDDSVTVQVESEDTEAPSITNFEATNPQDQEIEVSFDSDEQLENIQVDIDGPDSKTLTEGDFSETDSGSGFSYVATTTVSQDGNYSATLVTAEDSAGNDGADGSSSEDSVTVDSGGSSTPTPTPTPTESTPTPTRTDGGDGTATPTRTDGGDGTATPTPTDGGDGTATPTSSDESGGSDSTPADDGSDSTSDTPDGSEDDTTSDGSDSSGTSDSDSTTDGSDGDGSTDGSDSTDGDSTAEGDGTGSDSSSADTDGSGETATSTTDATATDDDDDGSLIGGLRQIAGLSGMALLGLVAVAVAAVLAIAGARVVSE